MNRLFINIFLFQKFGINHTATVILNLPFLPTSYLVLLALNLISKLRTGNFLVHLCSKLASYYCQSVEKSIFTLFQAYKPQIGQQLPQQEQDQHHQPPGLYGALNCSRSPGGSSSQGGDHDPQRGLMTTTPIAISSIGMSSTTSASVTSEEVSEERTKALVLPPLVALPKQILKVLVHKIGFPAIFFFHLQSSFCKTAIYVKCCKAFFERIGKFDLISI